MISTKKVAAYRIYKIVFMSVKFFLQVYFFQRKHQGRWDATTERKWAELAGKQAREYKQTALKLEGLMIKMGQFLSTRADIMPRSFILELEGLTDRVPPVPWEEAKRVIEDDWNTAYGNIVHKISENPVASASIGDVYHAWLHNGDSVAIKVQRPGIERIIRTDFKAMKIVIWLAKRFTRFGKQVDLDALYREMTIVIGDELNFKKELQNGVAFGERFKDTPGVIVPRYIEEYTTRRVLVMDWIEGSKITDQSFLDKHGLNREELAENLLLLFIEQLLNEGMFHADPHGGNILIKEDGTIVLIDFGMVGVIRKKDAEAVQRAVEGVIFERYSEVVEALEQMKFLLPKADKDILEDVVERVVQVYKSGEWQDGESLMMESLLEDIQDIVRTQPIQLPTEFAFFGRAISTFTGVIYTIYPEADFIEMARPTIVRWATARNDDREDSAPWQTAVRYIQPLLSAPSKFSDALDEPKRYRRMMQWSNKKDRTLQELTARRRDIIIITAIPFISLHAGILIENWLLTGIAGALTAAGALRYRSISGKIARESEEEYS
ncbi:AarF/ABC1/UbiB kinase family protein [Jeotgalibacillus sp. R-1-5s-1]|uniref:ABC1 kinase family protein n=1 Tax=Jeotgalibacillus sp. R-1-5s-1 TaxID=2555897 RepID=UPI00106D4981|nr:AarF/UbiB family protein [Jeotgalibacillus sp. R-1-5s-1]TFD97645.1 AarF/ABC1/UbiB kinase family protein [Jeotgalibacillus sp. R-1-5s-1]